MSSSSQAESPCVISLDDGDSNNSCIITEAPSTPVPPPVRYFKDKTPPVILWGEFDYTYKEDDPMTLAVIKDIKKKSVLSVTDPMMAEDEEASFLLFPGKLGDMDERVVHSIKLQEYERTITSMIEDIKAGDALDDSNSNPYPPVPQVPYPIKTIENRSSYFPNICMLRDPTNFARGKSKPDLILPVPCAKILLTKSVETLLTFHTYTDSSEEALSILVDVVEDVISSLCSTVSFYVDQEDMIGTSGFHSAIERSLTEMNLGSAADILQYYQTNILDVHLVLQRRCYRLQNTFSRLVQCKADEDSAAEHMEVNTISMEEEEYEDDDDEEDIPELHFPALDEDDQLGLQPSLETGFQMLDSLEHDESLQNLDPDEEINVDSPSQEFMLSVISELSNTLDFSKGKKRRKKSP